MATYGQRVNQLAFASTHAHSKSRAKNQIKSVPKKAARRKGK